MARANPQFNGFRHYTPEGTVGMPQLVPCFVASGYATADLYPGDPVELVNDGSIKRTVAGTNGVYGVIHSILQFRNSDGVLVRNGRYIPLSTTWTAHADRSMALVIPAKNNYFAVQASASVADLATARSLKGENADHAFTGTASQPLGITSALLDIATHATTNTLQWRIIDFLEAPSNDPTQTRFTCIVEANILSDSAGLPAVLGV